MTDSSPPPPTTLGRYRVVRRLGAGGMAEVFLAKSAGAEGLEKLLVVKRVLPTFSRSPKFLAMFVDEAKLAMRLNHPNIVQVYAFEQVRDEFLLAMEFVDGMDLGRLVAAARRAGRALPHHLAALVVLEVAKGLDYAHNRKDETGAPMEIVHRDVSPQNVLCSYDGAVKVADFGIARARMITEETGVIKGKFAYMSPEQARGARVDRRSDVYALGVMLAELLMGRPMYPGLQGMEVLEAVRDGQITAPRSVDPSVPAELEQIALRALAGDREERFQTCRSMAGALSRWLHAQEEPYDLGELERFFADVAPREVTSPDGGGGGGAGVPLGAQPTLLSVPVGGGTREVRERRHVVAVSGFFRAPEGEDATPEGTRDLPIEPAMRVLGDIAFKYGAILDRPTREEGAPSFTFLLGLGRASVDDPLRASRLALDVLEALDGLSADALVPMTAALGVSRGAVTSVRAPDRRPRWEPEGAVLAVARELARAAAAEQVLVSGEVYRLARRAFAFAEDEARDVTVPTEGGPRSLRAWRVLGARGREDRAGVAQRVARQVGLVGRADEVQALAAMWAEVLQNGRGAWVALVGELGVGKSALAAAAIARLDPAPRLLRVECPFGSSDVPYAAVAELVREALGLEGETPEARLASLEQRTDALALPAARKRQLVEAFAPLVGAAGAAGGDGGGEPGDDRSQRLFSAVRLLLGAIARVTPLVVWVDAMQFMDPPSRDLLARQVPHELAVPMLVVFCTRPDERVEEALRGALRVDVEPLEGDARAELVRAHLGGADVPAELLAAITQRAGGNPFFLVELVDALLERGVVRVEGEGEGRHAVRKPGAALSLPSTLEDVIAARIGELAERERLVLRWLAVAGAGLSEDDLGELVGGEFGAPVRALTERGLVERRGARGLSFTSVVVRHVAYEGLDAAERARMHRRVGAFLAASPGRAPAARVARHHELAGEPALAARAWREAGEAARAVYSNREALGFFARALALLPEGARERFELHERREQILRVRSERAGQRVELEAMRALSERLRDPRLVAVALARLARHDLDGGRYVGVDAMLRRALEASIEAGDRAAEVECLRLVGHLRRDQGDVEGALEAFDRALGRAGLDAEHLPARGMVLVSRASLLRRRGLLADAIESAAEGYAVFHRLGLKGQAAFALNALGVSLSSDGRFEDAIACVRASIVLDREAGDLLHLGRKASNVGQLYAELGDTPRALAFLDRALAVFERADDQPARSDTLTAIAEVRLEQLDDPRGAERALEESLRIAARLGDRSDLAYARVVQAALDHARGEPSAREAHAREAVDDARASGSLGLELLALAALAGALFDLEREADARAAAERALESIPERGTVERAERVHLALGRVFRRLGDAARADEAMGRARAIVDARLAQILDDTLRERYLAHPVVRAIEEERA